MVFKSVEFMLRVLFLLFGVFLLISCSNFPKEDKCIKKTIDECRDRRMKEQLDALLWNRSSYRGMKFVMRSDEIKENYLDCVLTIRYCLE